MGALTTETTDVSSIQRTERSMLRPVKFSGVFLALLIASTGPAYAQRAEADAEFQRGRTLMAQGDTKSACAAFEASMALEPARGTLYNLAICHEKLGKIATAWAEFVELTRTDSNEARSKDAKQRATALSPRLPKMRIIAHQRGLKVTRNGVDVTPLIGKESPVDPGTYRFEAHEEGHEPYGVEVDLTAEGTTVEVEIPALAARAAKPRLNASTSPPAPPLRIAEAADEFPADLPHRPILIPQGMIELGAGASLLTSGKYDRFGVDSAASVRGRIGPLEASAVAEFHVRAPYRMNKPNPWESAGVVVRYPVDPTFVVAGSYIEHQPLRTERRGADIGAAVERKLLVYPTVAVDGQAGFMFSQRGDSDELILNGAGQVQISVFGPVSLAGMAALRFNLAGQLYDYTTGLDVSALALWAIAPHIDVFARVGSSLLPDSTEQMYGIGASWRLR